MHSETGSGQTTTDTPNNIINISSANRQQLGPCSTRAIDLSEPATAKQGNAELLACLTLVAPSGLTVDDRQAWLAVARQTLSGIPADLLAQGCAEARKRCRFPSEIVPTITATVEKEWEWRIARSKRPPVASVAPVAYLPQEDRPLTVEEVMKLDRRLLRMGREHGWIDADVLAEVDRRRAAA